MNKKASTYLVVIAVILVAIAGAYLLSSSHFDLIDYLIKLHGG